MKKYLAKIELSNGTWYYGVSNDKFRESKLTPARIARIGYKTEEGASRNWYYNNIDIGKKSIIEFEV